MATTPAELVESLVEVRRTADYVAEHLDLMPGAELDLETLVDAWVTSKRAANRLYRLCKEAEPLLMSAAQPGSRGWTASDGYPLELRSGRWECEVLDEAEWEAWCQARGIEAWEVKRGPSKDAKDAAKTALLDDGEKAGGASVGHGSPTLALGRRS